jgi:hypothetical protein
MELISQLGWAISRWNPLNLREEMDDWATTFGVALA